MGLLLEVLKTFFARHWLVGLTNAALTALLGRALVGAARRAGLLRSESALRLGRVVTLAALFKGAVYLVLGLGVVFLPGHPLVIGLQLPDVRETLGLEPQTGYSIWHPTGLPAWVKLALLGAALALLLGRAVQIALACRWLDSLARLGGAEDRQRTEALLRQAATALGLPPEARLPRLILLPTGTRADALPTPFLLGVRRPRIVLSAGLTALLTDAELEVVLRHELAHLVRRDHWWRWLQLCAEDIGRSTLLAGPLSRTAVEMEEGLCDRLAIRSARDAHLLGLALQKARILPGATEGARAGTPASAGSPADALPSLLGGYAASWQRSAPLARRLGMLLAAGRDAARPTRARDASPWAGAAGVIRFVSRFVLALLLLVVVLVKFELTLNPWFRDPRPAGQASATPASRPTQPPASPPRF